MICSSLRISWIVLVNALCVAGVHASSGTDEGHIQVAMRMIGHEVLLDAGDSVSRVMPIAKEGERYGIAFETDFGFKPEELAATIDRVMQHTGIADGYRVEVETCGPGLVVYSYEIGHAAHSDIIPCKTREQPKACYNLFITLLDAGTPAASVHTITPDRAAEPGSGKGTNRTAFILLLASFSLVVAAGGYFWKKEKKPGVDGDPVVIPLGAYRFDTRNMELCFRGEKIELSSKETDLLYLLYASANATLEREVILKEVWGDEGDYVGRTLDVFISKLRKKLEGDSSVKIANIRGVGYKLILNDRN